MRDGVKAAVDRLRARVLGSWPCARDLVFSYRAGERDPLDFEAALPEIDLGPIAQAIFAKLAPGRLLPALERVDGHTYDWGEDAASITAEGDGILVADYAVREPVRDVGPSRTVYHVVVSEDACATIETGSAAQRVAQPRLVVRLSATVDAIDIATDAILSLAPDFGLAFIEPIDAPVRVGRQRRSSAAVRAFTQVLGCEGRPGSTAHQFAWIVIGMVPAWFDFGADKFAVEPGEHSSLDLVWKSPRHPSRRARIRLSSSRNIDCIATDGGTIVDRGMMSMHYTPSAKQHERARLVVLCALRWLLPDHPVDELPAEVVARVRAGCVFPDSEDT